MIVMFFCSSVELKYKIMVKLHLFYNCYVFIFIFQECKSSRKRNKQKDAEKVF